MTNTKPELPEPKWIYHGSDVDGEDDLFLFAASGAVDRECATCERLYTADQLRAHGDACEAYGRATATAQGAGDGVADFEAWDSAINSAGEIKTNSKDEMIAKRGGQVYDYLLSRGPSERPALPLKVSASTERVWRAIYERIVFAGEPVADVFADYEEATRPAAPDGWIAVGERLPEPGMYWAVLKHGMVLQLHWSGTYWTGGITRDCKRPTHWQPIFDAQPPAAPE